MPRMVDIDDLVVQSSQRAHDEPVGFCQALSRKTLTKRWLLDDVAATAARTCFVPLLNRPEAAHLRLLDY
jgi:hypothetical protein